MGSDTNDSEIKELRDMVEDHADRLKALESAFPKDSDGEVGYYTHRVYHRDILTYAEESKKRKSEALYEILRWAGIAALASIASIVFQNYPTILAILTK